MSAKSQPRDTRRILLWANAAALVVVGGLLFVYLARGRAHEILTRLFIGWIWHLGEHLPKTTWNLQSMALGIVLLTAILGICHGVASRRARGAWPWRRTALAALLPLLMIGSGGALGLLVHHLSYLPREPFFYFDDVWDSTRNISNARQLITALLIYSADHNGEYPGRLEDLLAEEILDEEQFEQLSHALMQKQMKIPWLVLGGLNDSAPGDLPLVVSPIPLHGRRYVMGTNDSSVGVVQPEEYHAAMARWEAWLRAHNKPRTTIPFR